MKDHKIIQEQPKAQKTSFFKSMFNSADEFGTSLKQTETPSIVDKFELTIDNSPLKACEQVKGLYLYGGPGSGKTFMMDLFYSQVAISNKRRASYTSFVLQIHKMNHMHYKNKVYDPLFRTSLDVAKQFRLFCFDEMQVTEVGDAILMKRFFDTMWNL